MTLNDNSLHSLNPERRLLAERLPGVRGKLDITSCGSTGGRLSLLRLGASAAGGDHDMMPRVQSGTPIMGAFKHYNNIFQVLWNPG